MWFPKCYFSTECIRNKTQHWSKAFTRHLKVVSIDCRFTDSRRQKKQSKSHKEGGMLAYLNPETKFKGKQKQQWKWWASFSLTDHLFLHVMIKTKKKPEWLNGNKDITIKTAWDETEVGVPGTSLNFDLYANAGIGTEVKLASVDHYTEQNLSFRNQTKSLNISPTKPTENLWCERWQGSIRRLPRFSGRPLDFGCC